MPTFRKAICTKKGGPETIQIAEEDISDPGPGEARLKILTAGVAFADVLMRYGKYPSQPAFPFTLGYDCIAVVDAIGTGVTAFQLGDKVAALTKVGCQAEYLLWPAVDLVPVPAGLDDVKSVALVLNYVTAYQMLHRSAKVQSGQSILVHGAGGGVGTALLELARLIPNVTVYGTASASKHDVIKGLSGIPIDYKSEDFVERIKTLTDGKGVDVVFESIGGSHLGRSTKVLKKEGAVIVYGLGNSVPNQGRKGGGFRTFLATGLIIAYNALSPWGARISLYVVTDMKMEHPDWFRDDLQMLFEMLKEKKIDPLIGRVGPLSDAQELERLIENAGVTGKIVVRVHE